ncbi:MAG TPA: TraM recognition domain-containing protein [Pirellulales bacterium]
MFWRKRTHPLDKPLFCWDGYNALTVRALLAGGLHAFGATGSGKTSSLIQLARAILAYGDSSMLVLCAKRGEYQDWLRAARMTGRQRDVVLVTPKEQWRFNMFGYEASRQGEGAGVAQNVTRFIMELRSVVFRESEQAGGDSQQWKRQDEQLINYCVIVLQLASEEITPANLHELILSAPVAGEQMREESWRAGYCNQCISRAFHRQKTEIEEHDFKHAADFLTRLWPKMADRTRSSIMAGTMATLAVCNTGIIREMFAHRTNFTPAGAIEERKIVVVDMPPDEYGVLGAVANIGLKYHWQRDVLRREITPRSPLACIWGDESSLWVTPSDTHYLSRCRSYHGCMVYICQGLNNYREALPGDKAEAGIEAMLSNFGHKLFFSLGDHHTAAWVSELCGKELRQFAGGGLQHAPHEPFSPVGQPSQYSSSFHEQYEYVIQPAEFMNGLRTGSPVNNYMVDAVLVRSGVPFSTGLPLLNVSFDQRKS